MMKLIVSLTLVLVLGASCVQAEGPVEKDVFATSVGDLEIVFVGHGTLMLTFDQMTIHVDPFSRLTDYSKMPKADIVIITHHHGDHLDLEALRQIRTENKTVVLTEKCAEKVEGGTVMKNGDVETVRGIKVEAVPAYNLIHKRENGEFYHPKGEGNGYVLNLGDKRLYIAGDTENIPEMKSLEAIDYAFLPMNLPYTMTPEMVADAVIAFKPRVLYPYHYGDTEVSKLVALLKDNEDTEVRVRKMK